MKELFMYRIKQAEKPSKFEKKLRKVAMWFVIDVVAIAVAVTLFQEALNSSYHVEITRWDVRQEPELGKLMADPQGEGDDGVSVEEGEVSPDPLLTIKKYFGEKAEAAEKIAKCESQLVPTRIGDQHLTSKDGDEIIGRSIGIFQIRTGGVEKNGKVWNRAKANGMTVAEFEKKMMNPEENIRYAKEIYDRSGSWSPWTNCMKKVL
ncbi:MAG: hypothetical protein KBD65_02945 [Candidatus Moranbacteria bacterium]|nr:hypothetical protein [Candidatus Moranbacteria bacterium]